MKEKNYSIVDNVRYIVQKINSWDNRILFYFAVLVFLSVSIPVCEILFPRFVLNGLIEQKAAEYFVWLCVLFSAVILPLTVAGEYVESVYDPKITFIRFQFLAIYYKKCMGIKYEYTELPDVLDKMEQACSVVGSSGKGLSVYIKKILDIATGAGKLMVYGVLLIHLRKWVLALLFANTMIIYFFQLKAHNYSCEKELERCSITRKGSYFREVLCKDSYGKDIRLFQMKEWLCGLQRDNIGSYIKLMRGIMKKFTLAAFANALCLIVREGSVYCYLFYEVTSGNILIGDFAFYLALFVQFANVVTELTTNMASVKGENRLVNAFRHFADIDMEQTGGIDRQLEKCRSAEIRFENVSFRYPNTHRDILKNINLTINMGEHLGIVGENGTGKSTMVKLICRLYEPTEGTIYLNGIPANEIPLDVYFEMIAAVFQNVNILEFTIAENVAMRSPSKVDKALLENVIQRAGMLDKVNSLHRREDTFVGKSMDEEGIELSGGEKQKIAIARADYKCAQVILFDEPTSALDPVAEKEVYEKYGRLTQKQTAVYISHRLSSTCFCDKIIVLDRQGICEEGTHDQLMQNNGKYAELYHMQAQYYLSE